MPQPTEHVQPASAFSLSVAISVVNKLLSKKTSFYGANGCWLKKASPPPEILEICIVDNLTVAPLRQPIKKLLLHTIGDKAYCSVTL
jgi:hypothetical protein